MKTEKAQVLTFKLFKDYFKELLSRKTFFATEVRSINLFDYSTNLTVEQFFKIWPLKKV